MPTLSDHHGRPQIHLVVLPGDATDSRGSRTSTSVATLVVPGIASRIHLRPGATPEIADASLAPHGDSFVIEPTFVDEQPELILISPPSKRARVNGQVAARFARARVRDVLQLDDDVEFHVTTYNRPYVGPSPDSSIGSECPICRVAFEPSSIVFVCPCGTVLHHEDPNKKKGALQCAQPGAECPGGGHQQIMTDGYTYWPEVLRDE